VGMQLVRQIKKGRVNKIRMVGKKREQRSAKGKPKKQ
jgi:hypothetical protein